MNFSAFLNTVTNRSFSLPIVILYVTAGCNLRCIMCSYRDPLPNELTLDELKKLSDSLVQFGLRHIVYSGGEPLTRRDLPEICRLFEGRGVKQSMLTNGLLLEKRYDEIGKHLHEIIVSIDGPTAAIHNSIRGVESFDQILKGIQNVRLSHPRPKLSLRCVVQKRNFRHLGDMVEFAKSVGVHRISFLAADVSSQAFHRDAVTNSLSLDDVILSPEEVAEFREIVEELVARYPSEIARGFISENHEKLRHVVQYFEALFGGAPFPRNHCNAPMVSAVITSTGELLPCFFLPSVGSIRTDPVEGLLNNNRMLQTRIDVRAYTYQECQKCVCTLKSRPITALFDKLW